MFYFGLLSVTITLNEVFGVVIMRDKFAMGLFVYI